MKCARITAALLLGAVLFPLYYLMELWMMTLVDRRDATSVVGFFGWSAFFFYLGCRGIHIVSGLGVDKQHTPE